MNGTRSRGNKRRSRLIWAGGGIVVVAAVALAITFAVTHNNGTSGPDDVTPGNAQPQSNVLISDDCADQNDEGLYEPSTIYLACGDGEDIANGLTWSQWGTATATGQGTVNEVSCVPDCADGKDIAYPVDITLSRPVKAGNGKEYFVRIMLTFTGDNPDGSSTQMFKACDDTPLAPYIPACPPSDQGAF
jgi:hypothetical protein